MKTAIKKPVRLVVYLSIFLYPVLAVGQGALSSRGDAPCQTYTATQWGGACYDSFALVFEDDFPGNAIDLSKWITAKQSGLHGGGIHSQDYDSGTNFQFRHPGIALFEENVATFQGKAIGYDSSNEIEEDGKPNLRYWSYTGNNFGIQSQYQFPYPEINSDKPSVGIYVIDAILPEQERPGGGPYSSISGDSGMIWPAYWMWNKVHSDYGELDGFEFPNSAYEMFLTAHAPTLQDQCAIVVDPGSINFGSGSEHAYYLFYAPALYREGGEAHWFIDNTEMRYDAQYYIRDPSDDGVFPLNCSDTGVQNVTTAYIDYNLPDIPMWLIVNNYVRYGAQPHYFTYPNIPYFYIKSIKYYEPLSCSKPNTLTATSQGFYEKAYGYNYIGGTTVTIDGTTNGPISIPYYRYRKNCIGNLEALAVNQVIIKGKFVDSGYLVLKASNNICNNYPGPLPNYSQDYHRPINHNNDSTTNKNDSLALTVRNSVTKGQISVTLTDISTSYVGQTAYITVYNMLGQLLFNGQMKVAEDNVLNINLSSYASGVYLVIAKTNDTILEKKIVVGK